LTVFVDPLGQREGDVSRKKLSKAHLPFRNWAYAACAVCGLGGVVASILIAPGLPGVLGAGLAILMIAIAVSDARHFIIPDPLVLAALGLGLLQAALVPSENLLAAMADSVLRGLTLALAFWSLRKAYKWFRGRDGIGFGDVKLAAVAGVWLDWAAITCAVEIAALTALAAIAILAMRGIAITRKTRVPFGCFFAPAIWLAWLVDITVLQPFL
jgi:leader peptidase (prepilin peptidase) / N-methyltransferase